MATEIYAESMKYLQYLKLFLIERHRLEGCRLTEEIMTA